MNIDISQLFASFDIMWKGMLGLFVVCGAVMGIIMLISKLMTRKAEKS